MQWLGQREDATGCYNLGLRLAFYEGLARSFTRECCDFRQRGRATGRAWWRR
jgi:hypothetical protein